MDENHLIVPEWICSLVGRLYLDNEAMRRQLEEQARLAQDSKTVLPIQRTDHAKEG